VQGESGEGTARAARGLFELGGARAFHVASGYVIALLLPRLLGSPETFGLYAKVMVAVQIVNNVLVVATVQLVSKFVGESESSFRRLLLLAFSLGGAVSVAAFAAAPLFASAHRDPSALPLARVVALLPVSYVLYAAAAGYLNGKQRFRAQARLDVTLHALRLTGILAGAGLLGWGALGAVAGVAASSVLIAAIALCVVGVGRPGDASDRRAWLSFMAPLLLHHALLNGMLELDVQVLARTVPDIALSEGYSVTSAVELANERVGVYHAAQKFAFVPYQLMLAMTYVVFPMIARGTSAGNENEVRRTIERAMRISFLALLAVAAPLSAAADGVLTLVYPDEYRAGAAALELLAFGLVFCSLFVLACTILSSTGRASFSALVAMVGLVVAVACMASFVRRVGIGEHTLAAAALGSSLGMAVAFLLAGGLVFQRFRTLLPISSLVRGGAAAVVAFGATRVVPRDAGPSTLAALLVGFAAYLGALLLFREIRAADLAAVRRLWPVKGERGA
jgi:stage V sporulation protein B